MFTRILVPLDGTLYAESILAPETLLAERCGAELLLVHATGLVRDQQADFPPKETAATHLEQLAEHLEAEGVRVQWTVSSDGPADGILEQAKQQHADLIAMRTHGRLALEALLHPSVTWRVFRQSQTPLLAWKLKQTPGTTEAVHPLPRFLLDRTASVLVPLDGSALAERALPIACEFAQLFGNPLLLIQAMGEPFLPGRGADSPQELTRTEERALAAAEEYLTARQQELQGQGVTVEVAVDFRLPILSIEKVVQHRQAGLVVLAAHGRSGPGRLLLGGTARGLLSQAEVPVILVRTELAEAGTNSREALLSEKARGSPSGTEEAADVKAMSPECRDAASGKATFALAQAVVMPSSRAPARSGLSLPPSGLVETVPLSVSTSPAALER